MDKQRSLTELIEILTRVISHYEDSIIEKFESSGLTIKQFDYLYMISKMENPNPSGIADRLRLSKPSVTAIVEKLTQKGLIYRKPSKEDKRSCNISLTEKGEHVIKEHNAIHEIVAEAFTRTLDDKELSELIVLLNKVAEKLF